MRLLLIGAPGAGKGTQATRLSSHFGIPHISSGDLLRDHVTNDTDIGQAAKQYVSRGDLVPDALVMDMLYKPVITASAGGGYVLDGFPRTVEQAEAAYAVAGPLGVAVQVAVHLDVPKDELVRRLLARKRGSEDVPEVIAHRIEVYQEHTVPLLAYYERREELVRVDGSLPPQDVTEDLICPVAGRAGAARLNVRFLFRTRAA